MATIVVAPFVLKDILMTIGVDNYESSLSSVLFTPETKAVSWQGLTPAATFTDQTSPVWTCTLEYAQDWTTANSLAQYLLANSGTQKVAVFKPQGAITGKPIITATLVLAPGPIGGAVNQFLTGKVSLGVAGSPVKTANP